jgi:hypothetical protein
VTGEESVAGEKLDAMFVRALKRLSSAHLSKNLV